MAPPYRGKEGGGGNVLTLSEEVDTVKFVEEMVSISHPMSLAQLRIKMAEITLDFPIPWVDACWVGVG